GSSGRRSARDVAIVVAAFSDRFFEDAGIGGDSSQPLGNPPRGFAADHHAPGQVVHPAALTKGLKFSDPVHAAFASSRIRITSSVESEQPPGRAGRGQPAPCGFVWSKPS